MVLYVVSYLFVLCFTVNVRCMTSLILDTSLMNDLNCNDMKWSSFLCILVLSSVLGRNIHTYYPDCGEERYKVLLNGPVKPPLPAKEASDDLHILFCYEGRIKPGNTFKPNHFVPLLFYTNQHKRKLSGVQSTYSCIKKTKSSSIEIFFLLLKCHFLNQF